MERTDVVKSLTEIFRIVFGDDALSLKEGMTPNDIENWDSLSHFLLITKIEKAFKIKFQLKELNRTRNVGGIIDLVMSKIS